MLYKKICFLKNSTTILLNFCICLHLPHFLGNNFVVITVINMLFYHLLSSMEKSVASTVRWVECGWSKYVNFIILWSMKQQDCLLLTDAGCDLFTRASSYANVGKTFMLLNFDQNIDFSCWSVNFTCLLILISVLITSF